MRERSWRDQPGRLPASEGVSPVADVTSIVERLRAIEEDLRDLAYDRLRDSVDTGKLLAEERRLHQARKAIEKAIHLLSPDGGDADH